MPRNPQCEKCELRHSSTNVCVWGHGEGEIMVIGEAPGEAEARTGLPFQGKSGQLLRKLLDEAGLHDTYITNVAKCRPPENRTPTNEEIKSCAEYLADEIATVKPKVIITLGATASKAVLKKSKITQDHGRIEEVNGVIQMPTFHPAYALRDPSKLPALKADLNRLARHLRGEEEPAEVQWKIVTRSSLDQFIKEADECEEFSFDLETSGLFPYDMKGFVRCVGFAFKDRAWVLPLEMPGSPFRKHQHEVMDIVFQVLKPKYAIAHNGKFDNHWLDLYFKDYFDLKFDTMLAHHIISEEPPHDLKTLSRVYLDAPHYDLTTKEKQGNVEPLKLYEYCAKDCWYTLQLKRIFDREMRRDPPSRKLFYRLVMPAARAFHRIELNGLSLDLEKFNQTHEAVTSDLAQALEKLNSMVDREVNWNSPAQVSEVMYKDLKLVPTVFTGKGAPSTGEEALTNLKGQHPIADQLVKYRELEKFRSTYLDGWRELMVKDRIFFSYKLHGTVTGRYSSRLHQVPRDGTIRNLVTAPVGWEFVQGDFSQAEVRIVAEVSRDLELRRCFTEGTDVHWKTLINAIQSGAGGEYVEPALETASKLAGRSIRDLDRASEVLLERGHEAAIATWKGWKEARKKSKGVVFGYIYGMSAHGFVTYAKLKYGFEPTEEEAERFREAFFSLYNGLEKWHTRYKRLAKLDGYVRNLAGRVRHLPSIHSPERFVRSEAERQAINSPIQGFIGDFKAMALVEIDQTFNWERELRVVGEHHDALLMWVRSDRKHLILPEVARIMQGPRLLSSLGVHLTIPMVAEIEVGPWGNGQKFEFSSNPPHGKIKP